MKIKQLALTSFLIPALGMPAREVLALLEESGAEYALTKKDGVFAFISGQELQQTALTAGNKDLDGFVRPFSAGILEDTPVCELTTRLTEPIFVHDLDGHVKGILDITALIRSLQKLQQDNTELAAEIDAIINFSSDEIYVTDGKGLTLRVNKAFEENSGVPVAEILGKNVVDLEKQGIFKPSVARLVMEQNKKVTVLQEYKNRKKVLVTGTPVFEENGAISRVIINTRDTHKLNLLKAELDEIETLKERYYQELLNLQDDQLTAKHIVAKSKAMKQLLEMAKKVAEVDSTVLILGETGVGKGLVARYIHDNSQRRNNMFVNINCGAIPENLLESELFGYEPGAFTGANRKGKAGKMELANKGTLFLDEIGDMPLALQVKLLHVLQEGTVSRIGGNKEIKLDVHFLAATNRSLKKMVEDGKFREDLYYRLHVIPLEIPPLCSRNEDITPLTEKFLDKFNQKYKKEKKFSHAAMSFLQDYRWPGNVRELENLVERLVIVVNDHTIEPHHLPETIKMANLHRGEKDDFLVSVQPLENIKNEIEKKILEKLYHQFKNTYKMAEFLKINQSTVVRKLKKHGIT